MNILGFETCDIQGRESILVVDHDEKKVLEVLDAGALEKWLDDTTGAGAPERPEERTCEGAPGRPEDKDGAGAPERPEDKDGAGASERAEDKDGAGAPERPEAWYGAPEIVWVDLIPDQIRALQEAFPEAVLRIYLNSIPHLVGAEELRRLEAEYGNVEKNQSAQRHLGAVRYAFDERQLSIAAGKLTLRFVTQDLRLSSDKIDRLNKLFDFCQGLLLPDPTVDDPMLRDRKLREHVGAFLESPEAETLPETTALIAEYKDLICPEGGVPEECAPYHLVKDTWLKQVERGDEETPVSYEEVVEKILAFSMEED